MISKASLKIAQYRDSRRWTKQRLAQEIGVSPGYLGQLESGYKIPSYEIMGRFHEKGICEANDWYDPAEQVA